MKLYDQISEYHANCRPGFVLFTEFIAFVGTMATFVGMSVLFSLFH